jgi:hypothetical protein
MDHYEVRQYPGWHHHLLMTMLAHVFLWHLKIRLGKKSPRTPGITTAEAFGRRVASPRLYDCGGPCADRLGATA